MQTLFPTLTPSSVAKPGAPLHTVFFGLVPPVGVARRAHELAQGLGQGALRPERVLHVSLMVVGKDLVEPPPSGLIDGVCACAATVRQRPFTVALNRVETWRSGPVVARGGDGVVGVEELHRGLAETLGVGEQPDFTPHMTLLYGQGPAAPQPIPPITWTVRDFVLIHSLVGLTRYEVLGRFPLSGREPG